MSASAIKVENLSKRFFIGASQEKATTFYDAVTATVSAPWRRFQALSHKSEAVEEFWALQDLEFAIEPGEVVGIIGHNGAGKSTLLKILSRITEPTTGRVEIRGRVSSLLEVGTGFHPELTGRENIYLNGSILGMSHKEIDSKFDAIVDFSGVEQFLETPFKRYSSGMGVRLAFAVAAHLDPDILIIDEVLAVGDAQFQRKCLSKMREVAGGGRTVLFVSHNLGSVSTLCSRAILLQQGRIIEDGSASQVIESYLNSAKDEDGARVPLSNRQDRAGNQAVKVTHASIRSAQSGQPGILKCGEDAVLTFHLTKSPGLPLMEEIDISFGFRDSVKQHNLIATYSSYQDQVFKLEGDELKVEVRIDELPLAPGIYPIHVLVNVKNELADHPFGPVTELEVLPGNYYGTTWTGTNASTKVLVKAKWHAEPVT